MPLRHIGEWRYRSAILDLGTRWRLVIRFTFRPVYTLYPLDGKRRCSAVCTATGYGLDNPEVGIRVP
jgi:hypothetical protein